MRSDKFTIKTKEALQDARRVAQESSHQEVGDLHVLAALLSQSDGLVEPILDRVGVSRRGLAKQVADALAELPKVAGTENYLGQSVKKAD